MHPGLQNGSAQAGAKTTLSAPQQAAQRAWAVLSRLTWVRPLLLFKLSSAEDPFEHSASTARRLPEQAGIAQLS